MTISFDEDNDVLYITFASPNAGVRYVQTECGDVLRFCAETNQIAGVTILSFAERSSKGTAVQIPEVGDVLFSDAMSALVTARLPPPPLFIEQNPATSS